MRKSKAVSYQEEKTREEEVFDDLEKDHVADGHWRPPYGLIIVFCVLFLIVGFGGGFGAGWAAKPGKKQCTSGVFIAEDSNGTGGVENVDIIRSYVPIDYTQNLSSAVLEQYYYQTLTLSPALHILTLVITAYSGINSTYDPNVLRIYIQNRYRTKQDTLAKIYNVAQRLQISPDFHKQLFNLSSSFVDVFDYIRNNEGKVGVSGRRLMASTANTPVIQFFKAFVKAGLQAPELKEALGDLTSIWPDIDSIVDLVVDILDAIRDIAAQSDELENAMINYHPSVYPSPPPQPMQIQGFNNKTLLVTVLPTLPLEVVISDGDDDDESDDAPKPSNGRRLLQSYGSLAMPDNFVAAPPASIPNVLIPTVWHFTMYQDPTSATGYGPVGIERACEYAQRMLTIANFRLMPSKFQLFISECRNTPNNMYLVSPSRDAWLACTADGYYYNGCGDAIRNSITDFPRAINIYVSGEQPPLGAVGYAWVGGSMIDPIGGHMGLSWTAVNTLGSNNQKSYEQGASALVHEVMHHLGMDHTFSWDACLDADTGSVGDTPATLLPVWKQAWAMKAAMGCMNAWRALGSNRDRANQAASTRVGIPAADANAAFDSCPSLPGFDETANYITYTYDLCLLALGHFTSGQVVAMHSITAEKNPVLYTWGQYYAARPPGGAVTIASPPPSPPPPSPSPSPPPPVVSASPPPPPPAANPSPSPSASQLRLGFSSAAPCVSYTEANCPCMARWNVNGGTAFFSGCTIVPGMEKRGYICSVDQSSGNCPVVRNSWWDNCMPNPACGGATNAISPGSAAAPPPSPPPPSPPPPPPPTVACGVGAVAQSGNACSQRWRLSGGSTFYAGCANPNNNANGPWCALANSVRLPNGNAWDFCDPACADVAPVIVGGGDSNPSPPPPAGPSYPYNLQCSTIAVAQDNCQCADTYSISFSGYGTSYQRIQGCTAFEETGGQGMCVLACRRATNVNNGKAVVCSCV